MTLRDRQAREYAAEWDDAVQTDDQWAAGIADFLRRAGRPNAAACVISWHDQAARLHIERRRHNDAMQEVLNKLYALRGGPPMTFDRGGLPPTESSD